MVGFSLISILIIKTISNLLILKNEKLALILMQGEVSPPDTPLNIISGGGWLNLDFQESLTIHFFDLEYLAL